MVGVQDWKAGFLGSVLSSAVNLLCQWQLASPLYLSFHFCKMGGVPICIGVMKYLSSLYPMALISPGWQLSPLWH